MMGKETKRKHRIAITTGCIPDGEGGFVPCPDLLTQAEAILYLRIDTVNVKNPDATLRAYRKNGYLRAVQISKGLFYPRAELERFIENLIEKNPR